MGEGGKKNEGWRSKGWLPRQEERKNFSMMKQSALLSDWTRLPPMGGPAPWQQALSPREKQPYPSTPPYFFFASFLSHDPRLSPITKLNVFIIGYSCKDKNDTHRHTKSSIVGYIQPKQHSSIADTANTQGDTSLTQNYQNVIHSHSLFKCALWA